MFNDHVYLIEIINWGNVAVCMQATFLALLKETAPEKANGAAKEHVRAIVSIHHTVGTDFVIEISIII